jgi:SAM-dependent methyltransferase
MKLGDYQPERRYRERARDYHAHRPSYPAGAIARLRAILVDGSVVAELGAGTGIFTRQLLDAGWQVRAIEPDPAMRAIAERALAGRARFRSIAAAAEATTLAAASCDAVVAAQAFHWFDPDRTLAEIHRILVPGGVVALVWNELDRAGDRFHRGLHALIRRCPDHAAHHLAELDDFGDRMGRLFADWSVRDERFDHRQSLDLAGLRGRMASSSYWPARDAPGAAAIAEALDRLFAEHQERGRITLRYETRLLVMSRRADR